MSKKLEHFLLIHVFSKKYIECFQTLYVLFTNFNLPLLTVVAGKEFGYKYQYD